MNRYQQLVKDCHESIRQGTPEAVKGRLRKINTARVPREFRLPLAEICRRIGLYSMGNGVKARLVEPFVRHKIPPFHQVILYRRQRIMRQMERSEIVDIPFIEKPSRLG